MPQKSGFLTSLYDQLASVKLTIILLLLIAAAAVIGTLLPQGMSEQQVAVQYGHKLAQWINFFELHDLYRATWFRFLLLLLCLNLIVCTLQRLPKTLKLMRHQEQTLEPQKLAKFSHHDSLQSKMPWSEFVQKVEEVMGKEFAPVKPLESTEAGRESYAAVAEKGSWSRLMVYLVHLSVLIILLGALIGSIFGFKGFMNINEGATADVAQAFQGDQILTLPFQVRCDDFDVSFYDTGAPKEYRSDLVILENGKEVLKRTIRVNDPLTYKGVSFYQSSYGSTLKQAVVDFSDPKSGKSFQLTLPFRKSVQLPDSPYQVQIVEYRESFHTFGPALALALIKPGEEPTGSWILANIPDFHGNRILNYQVKVLDLQQTHYTGLQVKEDPGVWVVWFGFVALLVSIGVTFYTSHRKVWIWAAQRNPHNVLHVAARTNKNAYAFEKEFDHLVERLKDELHGKKRK